MKKLISILLALTLLGSLSVTVLADNAQTTFDPRVTITTEATKITVTVNAVPEGQTPTLTVDCSFPTASVTGPEGAIDEAKVTLADGKITFPVAMGGTYTITKTSPAPSSGHSGPITYGVAVTPAENGTVTLSRTSAPKNAKITLTVQLDQGYKLDKLTVTNSSGEAVPLTDNGDGTYTFTIPAKKVTVTAAFAKDGEGPAPAAGSKFVDVPDDAYYAAPVDWAVEQGVTTGKDETHFAPNDTCSRAQMVTFLWRADGQPEPTGGDNPFTDVPDDAYFAKAVQWAVEKNITSGTGETTFSPNATVTRAQSVTFLYRFRGEKTHGVNPFTDVAEGAYYYDAVLWAAAKGVTTGKTADTFAPDDDCTRGQIVTFLYRAMGQA